MDIEVLKSYLVNLGFKVDQPELRKFEMGLKDAAGLVESATSGVVKSLLKWQVAGISAFAGISGAVVAMADSVATADQKYRLLGMRMFMTTEQARKMQMGMDALGASLEEIAWDPELNANFLKLTELQDKLQKGLGGNFEQNVRGIRDMQQKVRELRMELEYLSYGFISRLFEKMGTSVGQLQDKLQGLIDWLADEKNFKNVTDWFADQFLPVLKDTWEILKAVGSALGTTATLFTNLIGLLSGDSAIEGTEFSFHKLAGAIQHVVGWISTMILTLTHAEQMLVHFANAAILALSGRMAEAKAEAAAGMAELTPGTGFAAGGAIGASLGGTIGTLLFPGLGTVAGTALGTAIGGGVLGGVGAGFGALNQSGGSTGGDLASQARAAALRVGAELGINPRLIFEQWQHETNGFKSGVANSKNNLGGIRYAGSLEYRKFDSVDAYANFYAGLLKSKRYQSQGISQATTEEAFAVALKRGGYYEDSYENYVNGMKRFGRQDGAFFGGGAGGGSQTTIGTIQINVMQPNASPDQIKDAALSAYREHSENQTRRNVAQLAFVG